MKTRHGAFDAVEAKVREQVIPAVTGRIEVTDAERAMLGLPARKGGLGIRCLPTAASDAFATATTATAHLADALVGKCGWDSVEHTRVFTAATHAAKKEADGQGDATAKQLIEGAVGETLPDATKRASGRANAHKTSAWLTALPAEECGTRLSRFEFLDGVAVRYGWEPVEADEFCSCYDARGPGARQVREQLTMAHDQFKLPVRPAAPPAPRRTP